MHGSAGEVPSPVAEGARRMLPYATTWLDYCEVAFLVPEDAVANTTAMRGVLDRLAAVTPAEAARKRRALRHGQLRIDELARMGVEVAGDEHGGSCTRCGWFTTLEDTPPRREATEHGGDGARGHDSLYQ